MTKLYHAKTNPIFFCIRRRDYRVGADLYLDKSGLPTTDRKAARRFGVREVGISAARRMAQQVANDENLRAGDGNEWSDDWGAVLCNANHDIAKVLCEEKAPDGAGFVISYEILEHRPTSYEAKIERIRYHERATREKIKRCEPKMWRINKDTPHYSLDMIRDNRYRI